MTYQYKNFTELDFTQVRDSLKEYLKGTDTFKDYDFEGSALNALINLLAYNTQYNGFYLNMHASERFIATAQRRENVVALAKNLGYIPYSARGAESTLSIRATPKDGFSLSEMPVPRYSIFKASTEDSTYTFYTDEPYNLIRKGSFPDYYYEGQVRVFEGKKFSHTITATKDTVGVTLPNPNVQTDKLQVFVASGSTSYEYTLAQEIIEIQPTTRVYFIEEVVGQKTRVYFGDGIIGKKVVEGDVITVEYFTTQGSQANTASKFKFADNLLNASVVEVTNSILAKATGGSEAESTDSIRTNAPLNFETQGRAITAKDYKTLLLTKLIEDARTVSCWGGEDETPQKLGYVFLSWVTNQEILNEANTSQIIRSPAEKKFIEDQIRLKYAAVSIFPEVVDPKTIFVKVTTKVYYDPTKNLSPAILAQDVKNAIRANYEENFSKFQTTLRYSKLSTSIDSASTYVISNDLNVQFYQEESSKQTLQANGISIGISINSGSLVSSTFTYKSGSVTRQNAYLTDYNQPGNEVALFFRDQSNQPTQWLPNVGIIDRDTGTLYFNTPAFNFDKMTGIDNVNKFKLFANSANRDVDFTKNMIAMLRDTDIIVVPLPD